VTQGILLLSPTFLDDLLQASSFVIHHQQNSDAHDVIEARRVSFADAFSKLFPLNPLKNMAEIRSIVDRPPEVEKQASVVVDHVLSPKIHGSRGMFTGD
jgi:hypothetical protein